MKHLIVTVHGIRTYGQWSDRLTSLIKNAEPKAEIVNYAYGYFSFFAFLVPPLRWLATKRFKRALQQELERENWDRVDIVAHSFGTHLASYALQSLARSRPIQIHTLILAGSVLRSTFRWDGLIPRSVGRLCNECGVRDYALVASQLFVFLTGMAGRSGFTGALSSRFRNRYFDFGHSGYFEGDDFMRKYWVPLLVNDLDIPPVDQRPPLTAFRGICNVMLNNAQPLKLSGYFGLLFGALFWVVGLLLVSETARDLLGKQIDRANGLLAVSREQLAAALVGAGRSRLTDRPHEAVRYAEAAASLTSDLAPAALLRDAGLRYPMYTQLAPANARRSSAQRLTPAPRHTDIFAVDPAFSFVLAVKAIENPSGGSHPTLSTRDIKTGQETSSRPMAPNEEFIAPEPSAARLVFTRNAGHPPFHLKIFDLGSGNIARPCAEYDDVIAAATTGGNWPIYLLRTGGTLLEVRGPACGDNDTIQRGTFPNAFSISAHPRGEAVAVLEFERFTVISKSGQYQTRSVADTLPLSARRLRPSRPRNSDPLKDEVKEYLLFWGPRGDTVLVYRYGTQSARLMISRSQGRPVPLWSATGWDYDFSAGPARARNGNRFLVPDRQGKEGRAIFRVLDLTWPDAQDGAVRMADYELVGPISAMMHRFVPQASAICENGEAAAVTYSTREKEFQAGATQTELWDLRKVDTQANPTFTSTVLQLGFNPVIRLGISADCGSLIAWDADQTSSIFSIDSETRRRLTEQSVSYLDGGRMLQARYGADWQSIDMRSGEVLAYAKATQNGMRIEPLPDGSGLVAVSRESISLFDRTGDRTSHALKEPIVSLIAIGEVWLARTRTGATLLDPKNAIEVGRLGDSPEADEFYRVAEDERFSSTPIVRGSDFTFSFCAYVSDEEIGCWLMTRDGDSRFRIRRTLTHKYATQGGDTIKLHRPIGLDLVFIVELTSKSSRLTSFSVSTGKAISERAFPLVQTNKLAGIDSSFLVGIVSSFATSRTLFIVGLFRGEGLSTFLAICAFPADGRGCERWIRLPAEWNDVLFFTNADRGEVHLAVVSRGRNGTRGALVRASDGRILWSEQLPMHDVFPYLERKRDEKWDVARRDVWYDVSRRVALGGDLNLFARVSKMPAPDVDETTIRRLKAERQQDIPALTRWELIRSRGVTLLGLSAHWH